MSSDSLVMRSCLNCFKLHKACRIDDDFNSCVKCIRLNYDCDLSFFAAKWRRIRKKRDRVFRKLKKTFEKIRDVVTKAARLQKQFKFLNEKERAMIKQEFHNIVKLEKDEKQTSESSLNDFLFDVFFEQIEIFSDFDWLLNFFVKTVAEAFNSSWDFLLTFKCLRYVRNFFT